jgi:hypothetical protein
MDPDMEEESLNKEIKRATAVCNVFSTAIAFENMRIEAVKVADTLVGRNENELLKLPDYMEVTADG